MGKINAYVPEDTHKDYNNPSTKPLKNVFGGYQEKSWSLQEQIHIKLEKALGLLQELLQSRESSAPNPVFAKQANENYEILSNDLQLLDSEVTRSSPNGFSRNAFQANDEWIIEMKELCENTKRLIQDENDVKKLGKLEHTLTEIRHLINNEKPASEVLLLEVDHKYDDLFSKKTPINNIQPKQKKQSPNLKAKAKKMSTEEIKTHQPVVKAAVKKKTASTAKKKPAAKAKTAKKSTAKKTTAKKTAKKTTTRKPAAKKSTAKKSIAKKSTAKRTTAKRTTAKSTVKKATVKHKPAAKKAVKRTVKKAAPKKSASRAKA